jgi:hypothetical protein
MNPVHNLTSYHSIDLLQDRAVFQAVSRRLLTAEARIRAEVSPCGICGGQSATGTGFSPMNSVFHCQYHYISAPYLLMYHLEDGQTARYRPSSTEA